MPLLPPQRMGGAAERQPLPVGSGSVWHLAKGQCGRFVSEIQGWKLSSRSALSLAVLAGSPPRESQSLTRMQAIGSRTGFSKALCDGHGKLSLGVGGERGCGRR